MQTQGTNALHVSIADAEGLVSEKWLHSADLDFYVTLRARAAGEIAATVERSSGGNIPSLLTAFARIAEPESANVGSTPGFIAAEPNGTWDSAQPFEFGQVIYGFGERHSTPEIKAWETALGFVSAIIRSL
ncbi:MAG: hypothetical protein DMG21_09215 [Acidobacteria bacterium]|nr:MAG: hypothetical protein DMG21_09215 [Acidobacteriota bacterium]